MTTNTDAQRFTTRRYTKYTIARCKEMFHEEGLMQKDIARILGMSRSYVGRICRGERRKVT